MMEKEVHQDQVDGFMLFPFDVRCSPLASRKNNTPSTIKSTGTSSGGAGINHQYSSGIVDEYGGGSPAQERGNNIYPPRDTGRRYYIRERKESEDLLVNLLNLRDLLMSQNVRM